MTPRTRSTPLLLALVSLLVAAPASGRTPWTASKLVGTPEPPPPYRAEPAFPALKFDRPTVLAAAPGTDRLYVGGLDGKIVSFPNDPAASSVDVALNLAAGRPNPPPIYGLAFHPDFAKNHFAFVCYVPEWGPEGTRVSRFTADPAHTTRLDPRSEKVILKYPAGGHNGGCLAFGPDGCLYISTGDAEVPSPADPRNTGQDLSDLLASILRVDVDATADDPAVGYKVPADNPFIKLSGTRPEIWAYGFRNPWRMSFDRKKGDLWVGDVGWELWELIHKVEKGGNYGWSLVEGRQPVHPDGKRGPTPVTPPIVDHPHPEAASITGGYVYHGPRLPDLAGAYIYGDFQSGKVWGLRHDGKAVTWRAHLADTPLALVSFGEDEAGEIYLVDHERSRQIHKLVPNPDASPAADRLAFPRLLSATGLFSSTTELTPSPGVFPYAINAPLWSDGATARRHLAAPGTSPIAANERGDWMLPDGSALTRTVSVDLAAPGQPARPHRVETQVLHREDGTWRPYTYAWNADQSDATLVEAEGRIVALPDARTYRIASRAECALCHNPWVEKRTTMYGRPSASPLALNTGQLHRDGQLEAFVRAGLFAPPEGKKLADLPRIADPYDAQAPLEARARAYLQVNCSHCHQPGAGGTATMNLLADVPLDKTVTVDAPTLQGGFGLDHPRIIAPGYPERSALLYRVSKLGGGRMPRIGSVEVDSQGVAMLAAWIASMPHASPRSDGLKNALTLLKSPDPEPRARALRTLTSSPSDALALAVLVHKGSVDGASRAEAVRAGNASPQLEVRDLFETFLPAADRLARLGDPINPAQVLALKGDAARGREIFRNNPAAQCRSCHRLESVGEPLGPDLAALALAPTAAPNRAEILDQILNPSRVIDPKFATYTVATDDGQVRTGLLVERSDGAVVLKDAQNKATRIPTAEIEQIAASPRSLMPEQLLRDLTAPQAADLLEYLASLRQTSGQTLHPSPETPKIPSR